MDEKPFLSHPKNGLSVQKSDHLLVGGNIHDLERLCGVSGTEVLYVGDHIYGDVLRSKKECLWRTCLIIKELNFDIKKRTELKHDLKALQQIHHEQLQADIRLMRLRTLLAMVQELAQDDKKTAVSTQNLILDLKREIKLSTSVLQMLQLRFSKLNRTIDDQFHPVWGRLFRSDQELSRFGAQVRQYACIYSDHVKNFLHYGANHTFFATKAHMSHEIDEEKE